MNTTAYAENQENKKFIKTAYRQGVKVYEIDTFRTKYKGIAVRDLSEFNRHKFENLLVMLDEEKLPKKFIYH